MNIAEYSIRNSVVTWVVTISLLVVGYTSFQKLSRLEDPEFTIKDAIVLTPYPGASPQEVEEEVTNQIESAAQELGQVLKVESRSSRGLSYVKVSIKYHYTKYDLPQVWDELRRKVNDYQRRLPPGAGPSIVNDDVGVLSLNLPDMAMPQSAAKPSPADLKGAAPAPLPGITLPASMEAKVR